MCSRVFRAALRVYSCRLGMLCGRTGNGSNGSACCQWLHTQPCPAHGALHDLLALNFTVSFMVCSYSTSQCASWLGTRARTNTGGDVGAVLAQAPQHHPAH